MIFLLVSAVIGVITIFSIIREKSELLNFEFGKLEFYEGLGELNPINFFFFPSIFVVWMWIGVCKLITYILCRSK